MALLEAGIGLNFSIVLSRRKAMLPVAVVVIRVRASRVGPIRTLLGEQTLVVTELIVRQG